jgi:hypothetical protein
MKDPALYDAELTRKKSAFIRIRSRLIFSVILLLVVIVAVAILLFI